MNHLGLTSSPVRAQLKSQSGTLRLSQILAPDDNSFGVVRIALAVAVLVSHAFFLASGSASAEPLVAWTGHSLGEHAVQVFFFLSGVLVACSFDTRRSVIAFATARALRIFPGLAVCVLLTALVFGPLVTALPPAAYLGDAGTYSYIARTLSLSTGSASLPGVFTANPEPGLVNMSLWTLKYEALCYAGLAVLGAAGFFSARRPIAAIALACVLAVVFLKSPDPQAAYSSLDNLRYFVLFFGMGVLACLLRDRLVLRGEIVAALFLAFVLGIGSAAGELLSALFLGYATLWAAQFRFGALRAWTNRFDLSYGVYIYACPLQQLLVERAPGIGIAGQIALALVFVLPLALLSWLIVERPALELRHSASATLDVFLAGRVRARPALPRVS